MSIRSNTPHIRHLLAAALLLPLLTACSFMSEDYYDCDKEPPTTTSPERYINLSIVVSSGNENATRAPQGGEDGDGREAGSERENKVTGITLMLYQDEDGINTADDNTKIDFIRYYGVTKTEKSPDANIEASYTTGYQPLAGTDIELNIEYHAIVVANMNLTGEVFVGSSVAEARDKVTKHIYDGDGIGIAAQNFVMSSEADFKFTLNNPINETIAGNPALVYSLDGIRIERLAARIDFWMKGAEYKESRGGYEYSVTNSNDKFVLTAVTPFNLYNDDAEEFLFKRVNNGTGTFTYLGNESPTTLVIDPNTGIKNLNAEDRQKALNYYDYQLEKLVDYDYTQGKKTLEGAAFKAYQKTADLFSSKKNEGKSQFATFEGIGEWDNYILCYPKENALQLASPLYYYATGVAIEGDYYHYNATTKTYDKSEHLVYYGYLRHQGEPYEEGATTYSIKTAEELSKDQTAAGSQNTPMNFGVVRNNIYRISIDNITEQGNITWKIEVKNWDVFEHKTIFM